MRKGVHAMKRLYGRFVRKKIDSPACSSETVYDNAMKVYKMFAYVSGAVVTAAYLISQLF